MEFKSNFIISTTDNLVGFEIIKYLGLVTSNIVVGTNIFSDFIATFSDTFGGRSRSYEKQLTLLKQNLINDLIFSAKKLGSNALVGVKLDFDEISGKGKQMFMVSGTGTAVTVLGGSTNKKATNNIHTPLSADELNEQISMVEITSKLNASNDNLDEDEWKILSKYCTPQLASILLKIISKKTPDDYISDNVLRLKSNTTECILNLEIEDAIDVIYSIYASEKNIRELLNDIIRKGQLLSLEKISALLDSKDFGVRQSALELLRFDKEFYFLDDIKLLEEINIKINNSFKDMSHQIVEKGLLGNKNEKWVCGFCNNKNDLDSEYCENPSCQRDKFGFKKDHTTASDAIDIIDDELIVLKKYFT